MCLHVAVFGEVFGGHKGQQMANASEGLHEIWEFIGVKVGFVVCSFDFVGSSFDFRSTTLDVYWHSLLVGLRCCLV